MTSFSDAATADITSPKLLLASLENMEIREIWGIRALYGNCFWRFVNMLGISQLVIQFVLFITGFKMANYGLGMVPI